MITALIGLFIVFWVISAVVQAIFHPFKTIKAVIGFFVSLLLLGLIASAV